MPWHSALLGRERIMARYWDLVGLSPAEINGNVTGQVRVFELAP
jgi:hypothetical protein